MKLTKYGITLNRLTEDKIELVRHWRNDPEIQQYMEFRGHITIEMQKNWFNKINNDNNYYFIVEFEGKDVGMVNLKNVNHSQKTAESGIFLWDKSCRNGRIAYCATFCMLDWGFETLKLYKIFSHVLKDNIRSQKFGINRGYKLSPNQENVINQEYTLIQEDYERCKEKNKWRLL